MGIRSAKPTQQPNKPDGCVPPPELLDAMSLDELRQLLERYIDTMTTESYDSAVIDAYLDAIDRKEAPPEFLSAEQSFQNFQKRLHKMENALGELLPDEVFTEDFTEPLPKEASKQCGYHRSWRRVWVAVTAAVLVFAMSFAVSADFRTWIRETYEGSFVYRFFNDEASEVLPDYEITDLPEGCVLIDSDCDEIICTKIYSFNNHILIFMYSHANDSNSTTIIPNSDEVYLDTSVSINGQSADFYLSQNGEEANTLLWIDKNIAFSISGFLDCDTMVQMAESISEK